MGYCGAQLKSDGTNIYSSTSIDMVAICNAVENPCVGATDLAASTACSIAIKAYDLTAIGRKMASGSMTHGSSFYPPIANVTFDGTTSDSIHFGPIVATPGVGDLGTGGK